MHYEKKSNGYEVLQSILEVRQVSFFIPTWNIYKYDLFRHVFSIKSFVGGEKNF